MLPEGAFTLPEASLTSPEGALTLRDDALASPEGAPTCELYLPR